ncbi:MAG: IclR family transcriptional regulator [Pseudomonadota bacterium]
MTSRRPGDGTIGKAFEVLDQVAAFGRPVRFSELERISDFPKATLYRLVQTLTSQRFLHHDPDRGVYSLGVRLVRLAHAAWRQSSLAPLARPYLDRLAQDVGETVHLAQLDHGMVLYVDKRSGAEAIEMFSQAGKIGPAYCTGIGKAMLAFLDEKALEDVLPQQSFQRYTDNTLVDRATLCAELGAIRSRGYAFDREEHEPGIVCLAFPILSPGGRIEGGLSVTSTTDRKSLGDLESLAPRLRQTASDIAEEIAHWRFPDEINTQTRAG